MESGSIPPEAGPLSPHKSGFVALLGRPNAGKSTLLNRLLKFKLSIVSPLPQTTRHKILGILNGEGWQICFLDTPGLLDEAKDHLQGALMRTAEIAGRRDADLSVLLVEPSPPAPEALASLGRLAKGSAALFVAVNKSDAVKDPAVLKAVADAWTAALAPAETHSISALTGTGVDRLLASIVARLPESPAYYGKDQLSDRWERFFVSEIVREKIFERFYHEVPHSCAVALEAFKERPGRKDRIEAVVYVERPVQKGILIGERGAAIRELTAASKKGIEAFLGRKVELELRVKVRSNWRKDPAALKEFGYTP